MEGRAAGGESGDHKVVRILRHGGVYEGFWAKEGNRHFVKKSCLLEGENFLSLSNARVYLLSFPCSFLLFLRNLMSLWFFSRLLIYSQKLYSVFWNLFFAWFLWFCWVLLCAGVTT